MVTSTVTLFLPPRRRGGEDVAVIPGAVIVLGLLFGGLLLYYHGVSLSSHYELSGPAASDSAIADFMARRGRIFDLKDITKVDAGRFIDAFYG